MATSGTIRISPLCEVPSFAPVLGKAHVREWGHLYAGWDREAALADFSQEKADSVLPTTWVAHDSSGTLMGSISVVFDDLPGHPDLNPWLASLFVFPEFRGRGLGKVLTQKALDFLTEHHHPHAYLFTEDKVSFFSKFNFTAHARTHAQGRAVTIMKWKVSVGGSTLSLKPQS